jgi:high-affinity iron transporter
MVGFSSMPDADRWSLAFYVTEIHHDPTVSDRGREIVDAIPALAALDYTALADLRDIDLEQRLRDAAVPTTDQPAALAFLRTVAPFQARGSLAEVRKALAAAKVAYASGDAAGARHALTDAYLDGFEPLEARLLVNAPELVRRIEDQFLALREGAEQGMEGGRFAADVDTLLVQLEAVETRLRGDTSPWSATLAAFVVVIREGVESVLLVMLLLGLAKRAGAETDRRAVHVGWGAAIAAGMVTWFASAAVVALGGGNRELVEGIVALLAVIVLLYAGHFVLARMDSQRRIAALKRRFSSIPTGRRRLLLFTFSFMAAYREAFEVVLFLRAILLGAPGAGGHVVIGSLLGLGACIAVFAITARVGKRLNASLLLNIGGGLLCVLAFVLAGKGVRSLQEAGLVGVVAFDGPRSDLLGVFPTWQTLGAQALVLVLVLVFALVVPRRSEARSPTQTEAT